MISLNTVCIDAADRSRNSSARAPLAAARIAAPAMAAVIPFLMAVLLPDGNGAALETDRLDCRVSALRPGQGGALLERQATPGKYSCQWCYWYVIVITCSSMRSFSACPS